MRKYLLIVGITALGFLLACTQKPSAPKPTTEELVATVETDLKTLELTLEDYFSTHNTFPDRLISLTTPIAFIGTVPADPFNLDPHPVGREENLYNYLKQGQGSIANATLYSYGPDTDDDNASVVYDSQYGRLSNGDILRRVSPPTDDALKGASGRWYEYENRQIARAADDNGIKDFMWAMKTARYDLNDPKDSAAVDAVKSVREKGWQGDLADLEALLERNKMTFDLIHEGAKKPTAQVVIQKRDLHFGAAIPNFISMQVLTKLMIAQGKKFEAEGAQGKAVRNYTDIAKFGQSVGNGMLIGKAISMAIESMAYKALQKLLINSHLDRTSLETLLDELQHLEQRSPPLTTAFWHEHLGFVHAVEQYDKSKKSGKSQGLSKALLRVSVSSLMKKMAIENNTKFWTDAINYAKKPYPEAITFDMQSWLNKMTDPFNKLSIPSFSRPLIRETMTKAQAKGARIMAALELFKIDHNTYPDSLEDLNIILDSIPRDPFTDKQFRYEKVGDAYLLYSAGPDMRDDFAHVVYEVKNGVFSPGDIIFRE